MSDRCPSCSARIVWAVDPDTGEREAYDAMPAGVGFVLHHPPTGLGAPTLGEPYTASKWCPDDLLMGAKHTVFVPHPKTCVGAEKQRKEDSK